MTITRKQRDEELAHNTNEHLTTYQPLPKPSLRWLELVAQIAQDKRHDLSTGTLRFWNLKLAKYSDQTICQALAEGIWDYFPSVDQVIQQIEAIMRRDREDRTTAQWDSWRKRQAEAEREGKLATEEQYAEMRAALRKLAGLKTLEGGPK